MLALVALALVLIADTPINPAQPDLASVRQAYEATRAALGRSSNDQVRLAYWCEAHGLSAERMRHLAQAVLADPTNAAARGLLGLVASDGRWVRPEVVTTQRAADPAALALLTAYDARRAATPYNAEAQFALGVWADDRGLKNQAKAHFTAVTRLDPAHENAWKRLGYTKRSGRWISDAQLVRDQAETDAQQRADRTWRPLLEKWKAMLTRPDEADHAAANLSGVTDPRAVPSIGKVFGKLEADQPRAVQLLGQVDSPTASKALAYCAAFGKSSETRRVATETLRGRDAREYAALLISLLRDRIKYEITPVAGPGSRGILHIEGKQANVDRIYAPPVPSLQPGDRVQFDRRFGRVVWRDRGLVSLDWFYLDAYAGGASASIDAVIQQSLAERPARPNTRFRFDFYSQIKFSVAQLAAEAQQAAKAAQKQLVGDASLLDRKNAEIDRINEPIVALLKVATGQPSLEDRESWTKWWVDQIGYRSDSTSLASKATIVEQVSLNYQPLIQPIDEVTSVIDYQRLSCFGAGTAVQTINGPRAIETLAVGDVVLTQSTSTGALGYQPILVTHHNPPSTTFCIKLGGEEIVSSAFHRFWVAGRGWVMARDLRGGDRLRTLGGVLAVESVVRGKVEPVFNLDVAEDADFFAGKAAALVHDNSLPDPRLVPFDRPAATQVLAAR